MNKNNVMVQNLTNMPITYIDNDGGVERRIIFRGQELVSVPRDMIERMRYDIGGSNLVKEYLSVKDEDIRAEIGIPEDQIEYDYTKDDVISLLRDAKYDEIADALDFGPLGVVEMIVEEAVALPLTNRNIMKLIEEKTHKNIENMIRNVEALKQGQDVEPKQKSARRVQPKTETTSGRRVSTQNGQELVIPE